MNKRFFIAAVLLGAFVGAGAQTDALSLQSRAQMRRHTLECSAPAKVSGKMRKLSGRSADNTVTVAFLLLQEGVSADDIAAEGMRVLLSLIHI